jgi:hypothetical protein
MYQGGDLFTRQHQHICHISHNGIINSRYNFAIPFIILQKSELNLKIPFLSLFRI